MKAGFVNGKIMSGLLSFLLLALLISSFGCAGVSLQPQKTLNITLPHSGENTSLFITEENFESGIINAERNEQGVHVKYCREWTAGYTHYQLDKTEISYSDPNIEYSVKIEEYAQHVGPSGESIYYNCTRGNCGFPLIFELSAKCSFSGSYYIEANCSTSSYSVFFIEGERYPTNTSFLGKKFEGYGCPFFKVDNCGKILQILNLSAPQ